MLTSSSSQNRLLDRRERIRRVVFDLVRRRCVGDEVSDESVLAQHPDLLPELADELKKVQSIHGAFEQADDSHCLQAFERIEADWRNDCEEKGDRSHLCEAPGGPFRQMGPVPFFLANG